MHISKLHNSSDWAFLVLRLIVAIIFLYHGYQKWGMWTAAPAQMSVTMVDIFRFLSIAEPVAAVALVIGFWTQIAAAGLAIDMFAAVVVKIQMFHAGFSGQSGWEFELVLFAGALILAFHGAGKISLDHKLRSR